MKGIAACLGPWRALLLSASLIGSFAWTATLSFWLFWNHWSDHWWSGIQGWRGCCWLFWMLLMEGADQFPEVYDYWWRFPGIFFFWVAFLQNEVIEAWYLTVVYLLAIHCAVNDCFDLILLVISCLKLFFWPWQSFVIHSPLPGSILLQQWHIEYIVYIPLCR